MGTAGPIRLAKEHILKDNEHGLFFVFNSDVICEYPLDKLVTFHKNHGKEGTIIVTEVQDPSKYGVVVAKEDGLIERFVEKPTVFVSNKINAGLYLFNTSMIDRIPLKPTSIEREIFPKMADEANLYQFTLPGYWMDIGQPKDYLSGQNLYLKHLEEFSHEHLSKGDNIVGHVWIHSSAKVDPTSQIGPNVAIGANVVIGPGCRIYDASILSGTKINGFSLIQGSIIGW